MPLWNVNIFQDKNATFKSINPNTYVFVAESQPQENLRDKLIIQLNNKKRTLYLLYIYIRFLKATI